jgi:hypothetical protein
VRSDGGPEGDTRGAGDARQRGPTGSRGLSGSEAYHRALCGALARERRVH